MKNRLQSRLTPAKPCLRTGLAHAHAPGAAYDTITMTSIHSPLEAIRSGSRIMFRSPAWNRHGSSGTQVIFSQ